MVIVHIAGCKGSKRLIVEAVWRSSSCFDDISFVKLQFYFAGYIFLSGFYKSLDCLTKRCEPFALINNLRKLAAQFLFASIVSRSRVSSSSWS